VCYSSLTSRCDCVGKVKNNPGITVLSSLILIIIVIFHPLFWYFMSFLLFDPFGPFVRPRCHGDGGLARQEMGLGKREVVVVTGVFDDVQNYRCVSVSVCVCVCVCVL